MSVKEDIIAINKEMVNEKFCIETLNQVPSLDDNRLTFGARGLNFDTTVLYIDIRNSTILLNTHKRNVIAKIHMAYYNTIVRVARYFRGDVRSFNGDSLLVFFQGTTNDSVNDAVQAAMTMKYMLSIDDDCLNNYLKRKYNTNLDYGIGIDDGEILCTKVGVRGDNNRDLVWIGNAVNKAVKISDTRKSSYNIGISKRVYGLLDEEHMYSTSEDRYGRDIKINMWHSAFFKYNRLNENYYFTDYYWEL